MIAKNDLLQAVLQGQRRAIAKAITLIESDRAQHRLEAEALLNALMQQAGRSIRIGISGPPGVGKSTFIEAFGKLLLTNKKKIAVLAVDPSSPVTGGSILGDKTRMEDLVRSDNVFIRPSPSRGSLGGVCRRTREAILVCEAAGYEYILVETVGVGQSEIAVASMVDVFVMLQLPNAGDELQGIKKGILEKADIVVVTKADGGQKKLAERSRLEQQRALHLVRHDEEWHPPVLTVSAYDGVGLDNVLSAVEDCFAKRKSSGRLASMRKEQAREWFEQELVEGTRDWLRKEADLTKLLTRLENEVVDFKKPASAAVRELFSELSRRR